MHSRRVCLYVPGDRPDRIAKAAESSADTVIVDFEDAVEASQKKMARRLTVEALTQLASSRKGIGVRINAWSTGMAQDDIEALESVFQVLEFLVIPMVEDVGDLIAIDALLSYVGQGGNLHAETLTVIPLIETARGVLCAEKIAAGPRVETLAFGPGDMSNELAVTPTPEGFEFLVARSQLVLACAAAGRNRPLDGPYMELGDDHGLSVSAQRARQLGFGGKQVLHPGQLATVRSEFAYSAEDCMWAERVDIAFREAERRGVASIRLDDGTFVDYPIALRARAIISDVGSEKFES